MTHTTSDDVNVDEFLEGHKVPAAKFPDVGATVKGEVIATRVGYQRKFGTHEVDTWDDGTPKRQLQIDIRTPDGEDLRLYCKPAMQQAIREAVEASGGKLSDGGTLTIKRVEDGEPSQPGFNPPHQYRAKFEPRPRVSDDDLDF